jgi:hypothetical protein
MFMFWLPQVTILWCKDCGRYLQPPKHWVRAEPESKELLTFCTKRIKGLQVGWSSSTRQHSWPSASSFIVTQDLGILQDVNMVRMPDNDWFIICSMYTLEPAPHGSSRADLLPALWLKRLVGFYQGGGVRGVV